VTASYPNARWRKYLVNLWRPGFAPYRDHLADYLCRRWNATHETEMVALDIYYVEQPGRLSGAGADEPRPAGRTPMRDRVVNECRPPALPTVNPA
jgi:hypothetical protein